VICIGIDPAKWGFDAISLADEHIVDKRTFLSDMNTTYKLPATSLQLVKSSIRMMMDKAMRQNHAVAVFCEEPVAAGARNLRTYGQLAMTVGAIISAVAEYTPRCYLVPVAKWKMNTVGKGNASKTEVGLWLNQTHPRYAAACGGRQDLIDACCISLYGIGVLADAESFTPQPE
jgi:Holliday junction resolvasome RuvABC endonuclease subunit